MRLVLGLAKGTQRPTRPDLMRLVNTELARASVCRMEDPIEDFFIAPIATRTGEYPVFMGTWPHAAFYTDGVLEAFARIAGPSDLEVQASAEALSPSAPGLSGAWMEAERRSLRLRYLPSKPWRGLRLTLAGRLPILSPRESIAKRFPVSFFLPMTQTIASESPSAVLLSMGSRSGVSTGTCFLWLPAGSVSRYVP